MKTYLLTIVVIYIAISCGIQPKQNYEGEVIGFEKYKDKTIILVDFLNRDKMPDVLKTYYYNNLGEKDFYMPKGIISRSNNTMTIHLKSKQANEGYLFINKYSNDFITNNRNILYLIGTDTINSMGKVKRLIKMKRSDVSNVDTIKGKEYNVIKIN